MLVLREPLPCNRCGYFPNDRISVGFGTERYIDFIHECSICDRKVTTRLKITDATKFFDLDEVMEKNISDWNERYGNHDIRGLIC